MNRIIQLCAAIMAMVLLMCGCDFSKGIGPQSNKNTVTNTTTAQTTEDKEAEDNLSTLPSTINTYAKNYSEMGEVMPKKSVVAISDTAIISKKSNQKGMSTYTSQFGYTLEYPESYQPIRNHDGNEFDFMILDEPSGANMNIILAYPNILYESKEHYSKALEGNDEMLLKKFEVVEINGINAVQIEMAIHNGYVYQTVYRTPEFYYILSYVQGRGVKRQFDNDMKDILNSLTLN